jgi:hypothetical protein
MNQKKFRGVGVLILGAAIWLPTFGCDEDDAEDGETGGAHQGGASTAGIAGQSGGSAGTAAGGDAQSGGAAGSAATVGLSSGAGQGGTPEPGGAGQAGAAAGEGGTAAGEGGTAPGGAAGDGGAEAGGSAAGDGGTAPGGAAGSGHAGEQATGLVDCGGESCDRCCYNLFLDGTGPEFECVPFNDVPSFCGLDHRFDMTCDAKSDCAEGQVCCMERTKSGLLATASCFSECPIANKTHFHYELCGNDQDCRAPQRCVKLPNQYFRVCQ